VLSFFCSQRELQSKEGRGGTEQILHSKEGRAQKKVCMRGWVIEHCFARINNVFLLTKENYFGFYVVDD
jgi:hypothetical protein